MQVSAADTRDPNGRPLSFEWRLLQGDPERVRIEPAADGASARITLDWQEPFRISEDNPLTSSRVDIGVFANNGVHDSAPAILSWYFPPEEARRYAAGPDGAPRIASIDYAARPAAYADPMLIARADWRDDYHYAAGRQPHRLDPDPRRPPGRLCRRRRAASSTPAAGRRAGADRGRSPTRSAAAPTAASAFEEISAALP